MATIKNTLETNFTTKGAQRTVKETEQIGKAQTRLAQGSASAGRSFSAQSQGLGGLVGIYAAAAANVFAISAAFEALNASAQFETIIRGTEALANAVGTSATQVITSLKDITAGQLSIVEAARNANLALSAGFDLTQIEQLGNVALKASRALGRNLSDAFQRLTRGAIKLEPELLDELGIFTRIEPAVEAYALSVGKAVNQLTQFERRQAFANQVIKDGNAAFSEIDTSVISTQEKFEKLVANFSDMAIVVGAFIADELVPLAEFLDKNLGNRIILLGSIGLIVFNSLRVALVGLAQTGILTLSTSLVGLSQNFGNARANAAALAADAALVSDKFKGQGAFVGGFASEGSTLKKSLAEGGVSNREAVKLKKQLPEYVKAEEVYQNRLNQRVKEGNIDVVVKDKLYAQSVGRVAALDATQTMVNTQLKAAGPLAANMAKGLNAAAFAAGLLGKGLTAILRILNIVGIAFVVFQTLGSFFDFDVFDKLKGIYNDLFEDSNALAAGNDIVNTSLKTQVAYTNDLKIAVENLNAARDKTPGTLTTPPTTNKPGDRSGRNRNRQTAEATSSSSGAVLLDPDALDDAETGSEKVKVLLDQRIQLVKRLGDAQTKVNTLEAKGILDLATEQKAEQNRLNTAILSIKTAEDAIKQKDTLIKQTQAQFDMDKRFGGKTAQQIEDFNALQKTRIADIRTLQDEIKNLKAEAGDAQAAVASVNELLTTALGKGVGTGADEAIADFEGQMNGLKILISDINEEIKLLDRVVSIAELPEAFEKLVGFMSKKLGTKNIAIGKSQAELNARLFVGADGVRNLSIEYQGLEAVIGRLNKDGKLSLGGDQDQKIQDFTSGIVNLNKTFADLNKGTISTTKLVANMNTVVKQLESELSQLGGSFTGANPALNNMRQRIKDDLDIAQQMVNEASSLNALNTRLGKIYQKNFKFLDDLYLSGKMSKATGEIAKNADEEATFQRENVLFLNQRLQQLDKIQGRFRNEVAIFEIQQAINKAAKNSLAIQIQRVPLVEKELLASAKLLKAEQARTAVSKANLAVAKLQRKLDADKLEMESKLNNQFGSIVTPRQLGLGQDGFGAQDRGDAAYSTSGVLGVANNDTAGGSVRVTSQDRRRTLQKDINILTKQGVELYKEQLDIETKLAAQMDKRRSLQREIVSIQQTGRDKERQLANTRAEASAAGAQASSAARVAKAENDTAKILDRSILKREDILKVELNLERIKMVEAKKQAGAQAALAKQKAKSDKQAITEQQDLLFKQRVEDNSKSKRDKEFAKRQEDIRLSEVLLTQLRRDAEIKNLKAQEDLLYAQEGLQLAQAKAAKDAKDAEYQLLEDKYRLLRAQIVADRDNIAARVRLLNKTRPDALDVNADIIQDPSNQVLTTLDQAIQNLADLRIAANSNYSATIQNIFDETDAKSKANKLAISNIQDEQEQTIALEKLRAGFFSQQQAEFDKIQDLENQKYIASFMNLELDKKLIDANLEKTLAAHGVEAASAQKLFDKAKENYEYLLSAAAKMKELVLGITNNINEGLSNAIQKLFENAATRGASLTDGLKEIGLGMYEDIRKTIVDQTIVNPAQDMVKGFIGDITGFDLNKKGIDSVELIGGKVPVTLDGAEEGPITKVKREMKEKGEGFFTSFKEKAKGAFDTIKSSLGDFGSRAMETFRGLGSGIKNLFTGEGGILSGLGSIFRGLMGTGGADGGGLGGLLSTGLNFVTSMFAGPSIGAPMPIATGGLIGRHGVLNMAAGGQVNALRDRVPAMLEPGEFVMRRPAAKSIGAGNLSRMNATGAAGMGNVQFNIVNEGEPKSAEQQGQPKFDADKIVIDVVMRDLQSNGPIRNALRSG